MTSVSVVVPTHNRRWLLPETVSGVLDQRYTDWELIIVDDGSADGTHEYLQTLRDPRIRTIRRETAGGRSAACNAGLAVARGELVMFLDDDDLLRADALAMLTDALRANPDAPAACTACRLFHENGDSVRVWRPEKPVTRVIWREFLFGWWSVSGQSLYRTAIVRDIGGLDTSFYFVQDRALWLRLARLGPICVLPAVGLEYRQHAGQMTKLPNIQLERDRCWKEWIETLSASEQRECWSIRRSAELHAAAEAARADGQFARAARLQLGAMRSAPRLVASPLLGRPLWWGLKKSLLRQRAP